MKFVMLFVAVLVAAAIASVPSNGVPSISFACSKPGDIMTGHTVSWTPKDVKSGETLHITATGTLSAPVTRGAEVHVAAKLDGIPILTKTMDLCDLLIKINGTCPIPAGKQSIAVQVDIPDIPIRGTVSVEATAVQGTKEIVCVDGKIKLP
eukprot:NODE_1683_length_873_cov_573.796117_g1200_i1.p1 GENE.NODE_1683_length_873_cov_573.796117_g1200_i1~~NODE_1683_length_873_cov_573.796117_g1200_i1.p1  ORF type:complete len:168 (-),score=68.27 NODE_1683_length_873_cov_573.796117_g1200_i1:370-822(-)